MPVDRQTETVELKEQVEALFAVPKKSPAAKALLAEVRRRLGEGTLRVAEYVEAFSEQSVRPWKVNVWVKKAIFLMASLGEPEKIPGAHPGSYGVELDTLPWRSTPPPMCRVPPGSLFREGAYLSPGSTCMPPSILQIGCFVGSGTAIDSMVSIGMGAQIGNNVQLSCRATVGGWLAPIDHLPTIIEDDALLGSGSGVYDGAQVGRGAVLMAGAQIVPALGILNLKTGVLIRGEPGEPLRVPPYAVVAMGSRNIDHGVTLHLPVIVGRRSGKGPQDWEPYVDISFTAGRTVAERVPVSASE